MNAGKFWCVRRRGPYALMICGERLVVVVKINKTKNRQQAVIDNIATRKRFPAHLVLAGPALALLAAVRRLVPRFLRHALQRLARVSLGLFAPWERDVSLTAVAGEREEVCMCSSS